MAEPKVNAETNIGEKKTRKARQVKPKPTNFDQALAFFSTLSFTEKGELVKDLKGQMAAEHKARQEAAKESEQVLEGI